MSALPRLPCSNTNQNHFLHLRSPYSPPFIWHPFFSHPTIQPKSSPVTNPNPFFLGLKRDMDRNSRNRISFFAVLLFVGFFSIRVHSIRFDLQSGHTKCISEDIKSNSMTVGKYHVVNPSEGYPLPDSHKVTVRVTSSYGNNYHYADHVQTGHFAFQTGEAGDYMACFFAADHNPSVTVTVDFDWNSGVAAKDWSNVAKKGSVELMELELKKMLDTVQSIHDEMFYLREREEEMQELNRSTTSKMDWLSLLSLFIALSVSGLQVWHLKTFFEKKKLI